MNKKSGLVSPIRIVKKARDESGRLALSGMLRATTSTSGAGTVHHIAFRSSD